MDELPTPIALVSGRLADEDSKSAQDLFVDASLLAEAALKWCTTTAISLLAADDPARATRQGRLVASGSGLGTWESALAAATDRLHRSHHASTREYAKVLSDKLRERDYPTTSVVIAATKIRQVIEMLGEQTFPGVDRRRHSLRDVFSDTVFIRNRTRGHGAKLPEFYQRAAPLYSEAIDHVVMSLPRTATWWTATPEGSVTRLVGNAPSKDESLFAPMEISPGASIVAVHNLSAPLAPLARVSTENNQVAVSFANGRWNPSSSVCEFLDYSSGDVHREHVQPYADPQLDLDLSETSAAANLTWEEACAHNLPQAPRDYVSRDALQERLRELVTDPRHRIITLHGGGGMGKTALTLHVLWDLITGREDFGFDVVLWFSARDIDLLNHGPQPRQRDIADLDALAIEFARIMGEPQLSAEVSQQNLIASIGEARDGDPRFLLILDNLETFDSRVQIQHFLDQHVTLPSKVILTSRHDDYQGDYRLPVAGLDRDQSSTLLVREARRLHCEPKMTSQTVERLFAATGGRAYALKLAVGQIASGAHVEDVIGSVLTREDILAALFDRSFELLSDDGAFLFLLLGYVKRGMPQLAVKATFIGEHRDFDEAKESLSRVALLTQQSNDEVGDTLTLPEMAMQYSSRRLISHPDALELRHIGENLKAWIAPIPGRSVSESFLERLATALGLAIQRGQEIDGLLDIMEAAGEHDDSLWGEIANHYVSVGINPDRTEAAFRKAVEAALPGDSDVWWQWADYAQQQGNMEDEVLRRIRAIEINGSDAKACSHVAYLLSLFLREHKDDYPVVRRAFLFRSVRNSLERHRELRVLDATDLSRLGWLYLNELHVDRPDPELATRAYICARDGLELDSLNRHCLGLRDRAASALRAANVPLAE